MTDRLTTVLRLARITIADLEQRGRGAYRSLLHIQVARSLAGPCSDLDRRMHLAMFAGEAFMLDPSPAGEQTFHAALDDLGRALRAAPKEIPDNDDPLREN
jgi:hypothetical protein